MDSGCSMYTMQCTQGMCLALPLARFLWSQANRRINAANGTRIREHEVKQLKFHTCYGKRQYWQILVIYVKKVFKSVATTCDGIGGEDCHVLFTRRGGTIRNDDAMSGSYGVSKSGAVRGTGELIGFDRTGNTYGMEACVYVGTGNKASEGFVWPVAAP